MVKYIRLICFKFVYSKPFAIIIFHSCPKIIIYSNNERFFSQWLTTIFFYDTVNCNYYYFKNYVHTTIQLHIQLHSEFSIEA